MWWSVFPSSDIRRLNYYHNMDFMEPVRSPVMVGCYSKIPKNLKKINTEAFLYCGGVTGLAMLQDGRLIVGAGDGTVELVRILESKLVSGFGEPKLKLPTTAQIMTVRKNGFSLIVDSFNDYVHSWLKPTSRTL